MPTERSTSPPIDVSAHLPWMRAKCRQQLMLELLGRLDIALAEELDMTELRAIQADYKRYCLSSDVTMAT